MNDYLLPSLDLGLSRDFPDEKPVLYPVKLYVYPPQWQKETAARAVLDCQQITTLGHHDAGGPETPAPPKTRLLVSFIAGESGYCRNFALKNFSFQLPSFPKPTVSAA